MHATFAMNPQSVDIVDAATKDDILEQLSDLFARAYELDATQVLEALVERENLGSTGFGRGVAIPHARITAIKRPIAALLRLKKPADFAAADGMPVDLVFGLLSPEGSGAMHLYSLAEISRLMRDEDVREALCDAPDGEALYGLLTNASDRDAA
ncbi:PTS sugar transporter subunit IIA [Aurantiacibacter flavus]|uniref:PTS sugar transporter subunit IIA n=1 Tax=Aurantiacibacter flavus TaxID=3145232 RepID=A0ABV0CX25_9SPHN